jgi:hypothetical protein
LNIIALDPQIGDLNVSHAVLDITQSIDRTGMRTDGQMFTLATGSRPWVMRLATTLEVKHLAPLCGLPHDVDFGGLTESAARSMLGNCMHGADVGVMAVAGLLGKMGFL